MEKHEKLHKQRPALWMKFFFFFTSEVKAIFEFQGIASQVFPLMLRIHENFSIFSFDRGERRCAFMGRKPVENAKSR